MIAVDTNILARFYCDDPDDPESKRQRPAARRVMIESTAIFVPLTVVLEFEWVMRGFYGMARKDVARVLRALVGIEHVTIEDQSAVLTALDAFDAGLDLADALHVCRCGRATGFATFDRRLVRRAEGLVLPQKVALLT